MGRSFLTAALLLAAVLAAAPAFGASQGVPVGETTTWGFSNSITPRVQLATTSTCVAWNNTSGSVCATWSNVTPMACLPTPRTYLFQPVNLVAAALNRTALGLAGALSYSGTFQVLDAGLRALQGAAAFNSAYCFNGGNATAADVLGLLGDSASVPFTPTAGSGSNYTPVAAGSGFSFTGTTAPDGAGGRTFAANLGSHTIQLTTSSVTQWDAGGFNSASLNSAGALQIDPIGGSGKNYTYGTNLTWSSFRKNQTAGGGGPTLGVNTTGNATLDMNRLNANGGGNNENYEISNASTDEGAGWTGGWFKINGTLKINDSSAGNNGVAELFCVSDVDAMAGHVGNQDCIHLRAGTRTGAIVTWRNGAATNTDFAAGFALGVQYWFSMTGQGSTLYGAYYTSSVMDSSSLVQNVSVVPPSTPTMRYLLHATRCGGCGISADWISGYIANVGYNFSASTYNASGEWNSSVMQAGSGESNFYRWLNVTAVNSTAPASTGWNLSVRSSNTSFSMNASTPAWNLITGAPGGTSNTIVPLLPTGNVSRYLQIRIGLTSTASANSPAISSLTSNYTRLPQHTSAAFGNVTWAATGQPVSLRVNYSEVENGLARLGVANESGGLDFCSNATFATGNTSSGAYCGFTWNHTTDGEQPAFVGNLTDDDLTWNNTNSTRSITTDVVAPNVSTAVSISNISNGTFYLAFGPLDNVSGINRSWFALYNLSNSSDGSACVTGFCNSTHAANGSYTLCATCGGQYRFSGAADDNVATPFRHVSALANATFWYDPSPTVNSVSVAQGSGSDLSAGDAVTARAFDLTANVTTVRLVVSSVSGVTGVYQMALSAGNYQDGTWSVTFIPSGNFSELGVYNLQVRASTPTTTTEGVSANTTISYANPVSGLAPAGGAGGGGGAGGSALASLSFATPAPAVQVQNVSGGLLCPTDIRQTLTLKPGDASASTWTYDCRAVSGFAVSDCIIRGEMASSNGSLTGVPDARWSCSVTGPDAVRIRYSVVSTAVPDSGFTKALAWNTYARVTVVSGINQTGIDVRLLVLNSAPPLPVPFLGDLVAAATPFSPASIGFAALFAGAAVALALAGSRFAWSWGVASPLVLVFGLASPQGPGIILWWPVYGGANLAAWAIARYWASANLKLLRAGG